jgi:trans-aconitate 2-methyltransferase
MPPREWNAASYEQQSSPQVAMGIDVVNRLDLQGDERVLDAGCGTGRVTALLLERLPRGAVVAVDGSQAMVDVTREKLGVEGYAVDLLDLDESGFDAVLSTATFHWISDHERLFARLHQALKPGGKLVAQCGGVGNVANVEEAIAAVGHPALRGWEGPWNFATPQDTARRLEAAGFRDVWTWLTEWPVQPEDPREYFSTIVLGSHLERLPAEEHDEFVQAVLDHLGEPVIANYVRLNLLARR